MASDAPAPDFEIERVRRTIWAAANTMRAAGLNTLDTIEHLGFLLFLRLAASNDAHGLGSAAPLRGLLDAGDIVDVCSSQPDPATWFNEVFFPEFRHCVEAEFAESPVRFVVRGFHPKIEDSRTLLRVLRTIEALSVDHEHIDVNGAVYEQLIATLGDAGHLGQYFTPRHVVDLMVSMVAPSPGESVYDPAAGTGGFLLRVRRGARDMEDIRLHGRELNAVVRRLCVLNFLIHGADPEHLSGGDSLVVSSQVSSRFDIVLTNPPFGSAITGQDDLWDFPVPTRSAEGMFLQHVVDSLVDGGRAAIVCPEGLLTNLGTDRAVRRWLSREASIEAVVSLPSGVFHPYTAVRTGILLLRKAGPSRKVWFFDVGRDGFSLNAKREPEGDSDFPAVLDGLARKAEGERSVVVSATDLEAADTRLVAARYLRRPAPSSSQHPMLPLGDLVRVRRDQLKPSALPTQDFLCLGLEHVEGQTGRIALPELVTGRTIKSVKSCFGADDLLYGKLRPYLAKVAVAPCDGICSTELVVLASDASRVVPAFLAALLRSQQVTEETTRLMVGANHPRIGVRDLLNLRVPVPSLDHQRELVAVLDELEGQISAASARIEDLRRDVTSAVGGLWI